MWEPWQIESLLRGVHGINRTLGWVGFWLFLILCFKKTSK
jgi:hypothetical protein